MGNLARLSTELITLKKCINQRTRAIKKEQGNPERLRMVLAPYECELIAVTRIQVLLSLIYNDGN